MSKDLKNIALKLLAIGAAACSSVYAARSAPEIALQQAEMSPAIAPSVYTVELVADDGQTLETYQKGNRFYVLGASGARYSVRVTNPTDHRVEALISIDGLDVIDGEDADFTAKRGYIVPAHDVLMVDGFRTSHTAVAAFRFSSVGASYAERKGKGRNVGVVGVAIFEEKADATIIMPEAQRATPTRDEVDRWLDHDHRVAPRGGHRADSAGTGQGLRDGDPSKSGDDGRYAGAADKASPSRARRPAPSESEGEAPAGSVLPSRPIGEESIDQTGILGKSMDPNCCGRPTSRPGLGTAFGETRWSAVSFTRFVRRNLTKPDALAELRYNDSDGLAALGILVRPAYDEGDLATRETADPFPATRFAQPPR